MVLVFDTYSPGRVCFLGRLNYAWFLVVLTQQTKKSSLEFSMVPIELDYESDHYIMREHAHA